MSSWPSAVFWLDGLFVKRRYHSDRPSPITFLNEFLSAFEVMHICEFTGVLQVMRFGKETIFFFHKTVWWWPQLVGFSVLPYPCFPQFSLSLSESRKFSMLSAGDDEFKSKHPSKLCSEMNVLNQFFYKSLAFRSEYLQYNFCFSKGEVWLCPTSFHHSIKI